MFENLKLNDACKELHEAVLQKGFVHHPVATNLMLIVSELGKACEADRKNHHADFDYYDSKYAESLEEWCNTINPEKTAKQEAFEIAIKDSFEDEISDAFLRLMDLCGEYNIDIEKHIRMKAEYNTHLDFRHGKAY